METVQLSEGMQWAALAPPAHEHHGTMRRRTLLGILEKSRDRDLNQLARETCPDNRVEAPDDGGVLSWGVEGKQRCDQGNDARTVRQTTSRRRWARMTHRAQGMRPAGAALNRSLPGLPVDRPRGYHTNPRGGGGVPLRISEMKGSVT